MAEEKFPRLRNHEFNYINTLRVPGRLAGRLDLLCAEQYGVSEMYKVIAAANSVTNPFALRATIRPYDEDIRNELILRGYKGRELEIKYREAIENTVIGDRDWRDYSNMENGTITEVEGDRLLLVPDANTGTAWFEKYHTL